MNAQSNVRVASALATQLSALTQRPIVVREQPAIVVAGRPILVEADRRRNALRAAVKRFNANA